MCAQSFAPIICEWSAEPVDIALLCHALADCAVGHTIDYHPQVASTMPLAHQRARETTVRSGTVILADEQTAGRGRRDRRWEAPPARALLTSFIFKAPLPLAAHELPMAAGLVAIAAIAKCWPQLTGQIGLKWPNDLLLGRSMANAGKVGGTLVESSFYGSSLSYAVVGMGINVLQGAAELPPAQVGAPPPTSLYSYLSATEPFHSEHTYGAGPCEDTRPLPVRTALLLALCRAWAELLEEHNPAATLMSRWRSALWTLGQHVTIYAGNRNVSAADGMLAGEAVDVTDEGHLLIRDETGQLHAVAAGDVSLRSAESRSTPLISAGQ